MGILNDILNEVGAEIGRQAQQGSAELAAAIFGGNAFVQYGAGQNLPEIDRAPEQAIEAPAVDPPAIEEQSRGGRSM